MESTRLSLLTRDGAVTVVFTPALAPEQYTELWSIADSCDTADELRRHVRDAAELWKREVNFD